MPAANAASQGLEVVFEVTAGERLVLAVCEVGVLPARLRAMAGEVLGHAGHAVRAQGVALHPADVGAEHPRGAVGVLAEGAADAGPTRFGGQIGHRVDGHADPDGAQFPGGGRGELLDECRIVGGGQADRFGARTESAVGVGRHGVGGESVTGVGGEGHRDTEAGGGGEVLDVVVPRGHGAGGGDLDHREVGDVPLGYETGAGRHEGVVTCGHPAVAHLTGLLFQGHPAQ